MASSRKLEACFSKINRAQSLLNEYTGIVDNYGANLVVRMAHEPDANDLVHVKLKAFEAVPDLASHLAAEIIYHVRSTLDQMVGEIGRQAGLNNTSHLYFPFVGTRGEFSSPRNLKKMRGLPIDVQQLLEKLEPFEDGDKKLWGLGKFANVDKHNILIPIGSIGVTRQVESAFCDGANHPGSVGLIVAAPTNLLEGVPVARYGVGGSFSATDLRFEYFVGFGEEIAVFGKCPSIPTLTELIQLGEGIVQTFSSHCFGE